MDRSNFQIHYTAPWLIKPFIIPTFKKAVSGNPGDLTIENKLCLCSSFEVLGQVRPICEKKP